MTVYVEAQRGIELKASSDRSSDYTVNYHVKNTTSLSTAASTLLAHADCPTTFYEPINGVYLIRNTVSIKETSAGNVWDCQVTWIDKERYDSSAKLDIGEKRISFSTTGGTAHITTSNTTSGKYPAGQPFDNKKVIGLQKNGDIQGADIIVPAFKFDVSYRFANGTITNAYAKTLRDLTGTVNDDTFFGFVGGEVLFLGADGVQELEGDPTIDFHFLQMSNLYSYDIGAITGITKYGHEYLWVWYEEGEVTAADALTWKVKTPKYAYVEQVYEEEDFSALGIGTS